FEQHAPKSEIVTTFQALLELLKHQYITVEQADLFAPITIRRNDDKQEEDDLGDIDEYN
ncbi:MAG: segregation/condensation protein A, partial [Candidatus Scatosoma sp.]